MNHKRKAKNLGIKMPLIQQYRGSNYASHYEKRQMALTYPADFRAKIYRLIAESELPAPVLNQWGCDSYNGAQMMLQIEIASRLQFSIPAYLINLWYWGDAGWEDFQAQWQALPEGKAITAHVDNCKVIHKWGDLITHVGDEPEVIHIPQELST